MKDKQYKDSKYTIESQENAKPYHANPLSIPIIHKPTLKTKVDRLVKTGVLTKIHHS